MTMNRIRASIIFVLLVGLANGQNKIDKALSIWANGDVLQALSLCNEILKDSPRDNDALYLKMKALHLQGKYREAVAVMPLLADSYKSAKGAADLAVAGCVHLHDYKKAWELVEKYRLQNRSFIKDLAEKPFSVEADRTYFLDFLVDEKIPSDLWPGINGVINGEWTQIRFDTGATFLIVGKLAAARLHIAPKAEDHRMHAAAIVKTWDAVADSMSFENGPNFRNVPVVIMEDLGDNVIFGTNIIEEFLTTVDYPNNRFILTPKGRSDLCAEHARLIPARQAGIPFYLWHDHYMFAKGQFGDHGNLNLFFDSGLIAVTRIDGKPAQASFTASRESLMKWGFEESQLAQSRFFPTEDPLEVAGLKQARTLVWYDKNLEKDRSFGGVRIDGLISHSWLKNYSWTIDFEKHEYRFGIKE